MKFNLIFLTLSTLAIITSCGSKQEQEQNSSVKKEVITKTKNEVDISKIPLEECVKRGIYYLNEVDVSTYDSISTQYFHQVIDYTDSIAIVTEKELEKLKYILDVDGTQFYSNEELDSIILKTHELKSELGKYQKTPIGYVFVHTFLNKQDTMSAIIIANSDLSKSEAIRIKTITEIDPSYFKQKIRNIEN